MDGTLLVIDYLSKDRLVESLRGAREADLVLIDQWATLAVLAEEGLVLDSPWQFHLKREGLAVVAPEGTSVAITKPADLLDPALERIGMIENGQGYTARLTYGTLHGAGVLSQIKSRLWIARSRAQLARALRGGEIPVGLVSQGDWAANPGHWREGLVALHPIAFKDNQPDEYAGGIVRRTHDVKAARRYWNYMEKEIRLRQAGLRSLRHDWQ